MPLKPDAASRTPAIRRRIYMSGMGGAYVVHTGGLLGMPDTIRLTSARTGHAIVRALRALYGA